MSNSFVTRQGYRYIHDPSHPNGTSRGYVLEHHLIMEKILGRYLTKEEVVHHIDGDKLNNESSNLALFQNKNEHARYHAELSKPLDRFASEIFALYASGLGARRIAKQIGSNKPSVLRYLRSHGVKMRPRKIRIDSPEGFKWCNVCQRHLPLGDFYLSKETHDGYRNRCKECAKRESREYDHIRRGVR